MDLELRLPKASTFSTQRKLAFEDSNQVRCAISQQKFCIDGIILRLKACLLNAWWKRGHTPALLQFLGSAAFSQFCLSLNQTLKVFHVEFEASASPLWQSFLIVSDQSLSHLEFHLDGYVSSICFCKHDGPCLNKSSLMAHAIFHRFSKHLSEANETDVHIDGRMEIRSEVRLDCQAVDTNHNYVTIPLPGVFENAPYGVWVFTSSLVSTWLLARVNGVFGQIFQLILRTITNCQELRIFRQVRFIICHISTCGLMQQVPRVRRVHKLWFCRFCWLRRLCGLHSRRFQSVVRQKQKKCFEMVLCHPCHFCLELCARTAKKTMNEVLQLFWRPTLTLFTLRRSLKRPRLCCFRSLLARPVLLCLGLPFLRLRRSFVWKFRFALLVFRNALAKLLIILRPSAGISQSFKGHYNLRKLCSCAPFVRMRSQSFSPVSASNFCRRGRFRCAQKAIKTWHCSFACHQPCLSMHLQRAKQILGRQCEAARTAER